MPVLPAGLTRFFLSGVLTLSAVSAPILGQEKPSADSKKSKEVGEAKEKKSESEKDAPKKETIVTTTHSIVIDGKTVGYEAMAGKLPIKDDAQKS